MGERRLKLLFHPEIFTILGEQLVSDPIIAISELVKNSYDADATEVLVRISSEPIEEITIHDNGHGMALEEIERGWLIVGTPSKRTKTRSKKGRVLTGSMGIGRLAAFSLANIVELETSTETGPWRKVRLDLNLLSRLEDISDFQIEIEDLGEKKKDQGATVRLNDLKWHPEEGEIERLKTRLSILCSPQASSDFSIVVDVDGVRTKLNPKKDLPAPPIQAHTRVDINGVVRIRVRGNPNLYSGNLKRKGIRRTLDEKYKDLSGLELDAFWYPLGERAHARYWALSTRSRFARDMREELSGVRVYRDGIRVLPYGEPGNDWLDLERTYVSLGGHERHPRRSQVIAWVYVSREENQGLKDTANREGLMDNPAYRRLRTLAKETFSCLAEYRRLVEPVVRKEHELTLEDTAVARDLLARIKVVLARYPELYDEFMLIERYISSFDDQMERASLYKDRLTAGNLVNHIIHDVGASCNRASGFIVTASELKCNQEKHDTTLEMVADLFPRIVSAYDLLKGGSRAGAQRVTNVDVTTLAKNLVRQMTLVSYLPRGAIRLEADEMLARLRASDFWAVVANLLLNAVTCSEYEHARNRDFPSKRRIVLSLRAVENDLKITCEDNGPGLPDKPKDWIWQLFNSTRKGQGSGLGLYIVSDIVAWYGGTKSASKAEFFRTGARFEIVLKEVIV